MRDTNNHGAVSTLVGLTVQLVSEAADVGNQNHKHLEILPYPDENYIETVNPETVRDNKFSIEHIYDRTGYTFVPNVAAIVISLEAQRSYSAITDFMNPYLYCITTLHGQFQWTIWKRFKNFHDLHKALVQFVESETNRSINDLNSTDAENGNYPRFPTRNDRMAFMTDRKIKERCRILQEYLNGILKHPKFRRHSATAQFFNISCISFINGLSVSRKEGCLLKRSHDDYHGQTLLFRLPFFCDACKFHHGLKWCVIKDTYIAYIRPTSNEVRFPMLVDRNFEVITGLRHAGTNHGIKIKNSQRTVVLKCRNKRDRDEWHQHLLDLLEHAKDFTSNTNLSRFNSYAPIRERQLAQWFVNAKSYMEAVARALLIAKDEVFIADWWLTPELMLIRPGEDDTYRLDNILGTIADRGVRVYILLFKEVSLVIPLNSLGVKKLLMRKSKNGFIKVIRHPDRYPNRRGFWWTHHEKMVVIDQKIAFIGGIDLCCGRWDDDYMRLVDLGGENDRRLKSVSELTVDVASRAMLGLLEMTAMFTVDLAHEMDGKPTAAGVTKTTRDNQSLKKHEGIEMNDIESALSNPSTHVPISRKWISFKRNEQFTDDIDMESDDADTSKYNMDDQNPENADETSHRRVKSYINRLPRLGYRASRRKEDEDDSDVDEAPTDQVSQSAVVWPNMDNTNLRLFIGKDYSNVYQKDAQGLDRFYEDGLDRREVPRLPWHDQAVVVFGKPARDAARHFIQRWNSHKCEKYLENDDNPFLFPRTYDDPEDLQVENWRSFLKDRPLEVNVQCVRSVGRWATGAKTVESSIQNAYVEMIRLAEYFIYIENQFFISGQDSTIIRNDINEALFERITRAHANQEKFRIYIVLPLLPGFDDKNAINAVLYFTMCSITKGEGSLFRRLEAKGIDPSKFISFFGMRQHDILMGKHVQEIIYVHSKLMIVDDKRAICGSANINDRSLLGIRDSEICLVIEDTRMKQTRFDGVEVSVGEFCSSWRQKNFKMLLGIHLENPKQIDVTDPVSDEFYNFFRTVAKNNSAIYEEVFGTVPTDRARNADQLNAYRMIPILKNIDPIQAQEKLNELQGFVVEFPIYFLHEVNYKPDIASSAAMVPKMVWA